MKWFRPRTLVATLASVVFPLLLLAYLASIPGKGSAASILIQVAVVIGGVVLFGLFLARLIEQMNAGRVARWLETPEGREWIESLPLEEREAFESRFDDFR